MPYMKLTIKDRKDGKLILSPAIGFRIALLTCAAVILLSLVLSAASGYSGIFGYIITAVCVIGALYQEKWLFDPENRNVSSFLGLLIFYAKKTAEFSEIEEFQLKTIRQNSKISGITREKHLYVFLLKKTDGSEITIDMNKNNDMIRSIAERISAFCNISLKTE